MSKAKIPIALREQVWIARMGRAFEGKCNTTWCANTITVFDFQSGHNIPESKGGPTDLTNLVPICARCNLSMGDRFTLDEWCKLSPLKPNHTWKQWFADCFARKVKSKTNIIIVSQHRSQIKDLFRTPAKKVYKRKVAKS